MRNPLYVVEQGAKLTRESRLVVVTKDDEVLARVPVIQVSQVVLFGNVQVTTPTLRLLLDEGVEVVLLSQHGPVYRPAGRARRAGTGRCGWRRCCAAGTHVQPAHAQRWCTARCTTSRSSCSGMRDGWRRLP